MGVFSEESMEEEITGVFLEESIELEATVVFLEKIDGGIGWGIGAGKGLPIWRNIRA